MGSFGVDHWLAVCTTVRDDGDCRSSCQMVGTAMTAKNQHPYNKRSFANENIRAEWYSILFHGRVLMLLLLCLGYRRGRAVESVPRPPRWQSSVH
jgi:hypothetical protein